MIAYKYIKDILIVSELIKKICQVYFVFILEIFLAHSKHLVQKLKAKYWNAHTNSNLNSSFISVQSHLHCTKLNHRVLPDVREQKLTHYQVRRGQRNLCCKTKGQPQKYFGNSFPVRGSYVSAGMQVQQYSKHKNFMCWGGQRYHFPLAFLLQSFSGGITCFSRSARMGSTSLLKCCSSPFQLGPKATKPLCGAW